MATIDTKIPYPAEHLYWAMVKRTLETVFAMNPQESEQAVNSLIIRISERPFDERILFFHAEPLDVAADIAGEQPSESQIEKYTELARQNYWPE